MVIAHPMMRAGDSIQTIFIGFHRRSPAVLFSCGRCWRRKVAKPLTARSRTSRCASSNADKRNYTKTDAGQRLSEATEASGGFEVPTPILNSPFVTRGYWDLREGEPPQRLPGRRTALAMGTATRAPACRVPLAAAASGGDAAGQQHPRPPGGMASGRTGQAYRALPRN